MAILDSITPKYYRVLRMGVQRKGAEVTAVYDVAIYSVNGNQIAILGRDSAFTAQEKQAIVAIFQRDIAQFEAATGLTEWVPPEGP